MLDSNTYIWLTDTYLFFIKEDKLETLADAWVDDEKDKYETT